MFPSSVETVLNLLKNAAMANNDAPVRARKPLMRRPRPRGKPDMTRLRNPWVYPKKPPFKSAYQVGQEINKSGQFSKSYRCKRKKDKKIFAVKCISKATFYRLHPSPQRRQALIIAMQGEIDIMRRLKHKYIVCMEECYEDKHKLYVVMEECKGGNLMDRIEEKGRFKELRAASIIRMVLEALFYMHEYHRVIHCDLRPEHILFVNKSEDSPVKIIDFGMSKVVPRLRRFQTLDNIFPYYVAPESITCTQYQCDMDILLIYGFCGQYETPIELCNIIWKYHGSRKQQEARYSHGCDMWTVGTLKTYVICS